MTISRWVTAGKALTAWQMPGATPRVGLRWLWGLFTQRRPALSASTSSKASSHRPDTLPGSRARTTTDTTNLRHSSSEPREQVREEFARFAVLQKSNECIHDVSVQIWRRIFWWKKRSSPFGWEISFLQSSSSPPLLHTLAFAVLLVLLQTSYHSHTINKVSPNCH